VVPQRNNIIEQDHRRVKRITRSMLDFKIFYSAQSTLGFSRKM